MLQTRYQAAISDFVQLKDMHERCQAMMEKLQEDIEYPLRAGLLVLEEDTTLQILDQVSCL